MYIKQLELLPEHSGLALALLVARVGTDDAYYAAAFDDLAVPAHFLY